MHEIRARREHEQRPRLQLKDSAEDDAKDSVAGGHTQPIAAQDARGGGEQATHVQHCRGA